MALPQKPVRALRSFWETDRSLSVLLVLLVISVFVVRPVSGVTIDAHLLTTTVSTVMLLSGIATVARSRVAAVFFGIVALAAIALTWARYAVLGDALLGVHALGTVVACIMLAAIVLAQVLREGAITAQRIRGAIAAYLLIALAFAAAYTCVDAYVPQAFSGSGEVETAHHDPMQRFIYFSFVTLTTLGYGDITPVAPVACSLAMLEALIGQLFPAILIARLVSLEIYHSQQEIERQQAALEREVEELEPQD